jgi:uncharacterized membrane protein YfcA
VKNRILSVPELGFIVATRGMLGAGLGLLLSDKITTQQRRAVGWMLVAVALSRQFRLRLRYSAIRITASWRLLAEAEIACK